MIKDNIQNIIAEVYAVEDRGQQIKLSDKSKRSLGSFFKAKKDGLPTQAFQQFQNMSIASGSVVEISFKEVPYKDGVIKNIIGFREAGNRPVSNKSMEQEIEPLPSEYPEQTKSNNQDAFGRRLALHGYQNSRLVNHTIEQVKQETQALLELEDWTNALLQNDI